MTTTLPVLIEMLQQIYLPTLYLHTRSHYMYMCSQAMYMENSVPTCYVKTLAGDRHTNSLPSPSLSLSPRSSSSLHDDNLNQRLWRLFRARETRYSTALPSRGRDYGGAVGPRREGESDFAAAGAVQTRKKTRREECTGRSHGGVWRERSFGLPRLYQRPSSSLTSPKTRTS